MINWQDDTHELVANAKITLRSNPKLSMFYPNDPKIFTLRLCIGIYTWDLNGYSLVLTLTGKIDLSCRVMKGNFPLCNCNNLRMSMYNRDNPEIVY